MWIKECLYIIEYRGKPVTRLPVLDKTRWLSFVVPYEAACASKLSCDVIQVFQQRK